MKAKQQWVTFSILKDLDYKNKADHQCKSFSSNPYINPNTENSLDAG